jgi:hypothetical protein
MKAEGENASVASPKEQDTFQSLRQKYLCGTQLWRESAWRTTKGETGQKAVERWLVPGSSQVKRTEIGGYTLFLSFFCENHEKRRKGQRE